MTRTSGSKGCSRPSSPLATRVCGIGGPTIEGNGQAAIRRRTRSRQEPKRSLNLDGPAGGSDVPAPPAGDPARKVPQERNGIMAYDAFLKLDGVTGESQKANHVGEIDVMSFSWGASNSSSVGTGTGVSVGKVTAADFSVTKATDSSSPV